MFEYELKLGEFFDNGDDLLTQFSGNHGHVDELVILEAVANDWDTAVDEAKYS